MKVTNKLLSKFYHAKGTGGCGANENHNRDVLGITSDQYSVLRKAHDATFGCLGGRMTLKQAKFAVEFWI